MRERIPAANAKGHLDPFLKERRGLQVIVRDEQGNEVDAARLRDIAFGFGTDLVEGEFYWAPSLGFYYWFRRREPNMQYWVLLESFQHGNLMQAEMQGPQPPSSCLVLVEDERVRLRLRRRLEMMRIGRTDTAAQRAQ